MAEYPPKEVYKIFMLINKTIPMGVMTQALHDIHRDYDSYEECEKWIKEEGERYQQYVILKTYTMP